MHAIINSNHDTFICLPSLLQAQFRDTMSTAADGGEDFRIKTILSRTDDLVGWKHEEASADSEPLGGGQAAEAQSGTLRAGR